MIHLQKSFSWYLFVLGLVYLAVSLWPASFWLRVESIYVHSANVGEQPRMEVRRTIKRPFQAEWRVELERKVGDSYVFVTRAHGSNFYATDSKIPDPLFLDWWTYPKVMDIRPGIYRLETCWTIQADAPFPEKSVCFVSNDFNVFPNVARGDRR